MLVTLPVRANTMFRYNSQREPILLSGPVWFLVCYNVKSLHPHDSDVLRETHLLSRSVFVVVEVRDANSSLRIWSMFLSPPAPPPHVFKAADGLPKMPRSSSRTNVSFIASCLLYHTLSLIARLNKSSCYSANRAFSAQHDLKGA